MDTNVYFECFHWCNKRRTVPCTCKQLVSRERYPTQVLKCSIGMFRALCILICLSESIFEAGAETNKRLVIYFQEIND